MNSKLNVLYVEDHEASRQSVVNILNFIPCIGNVTTASNGQEALDLYLANREYDVLITDIRMPKKDGLTLIEEIKKHKDIFSIVTTAFDDKEYLQNAIKNQVDKYLIKPLDISNLINIIKDYYTQKVEEFRVKHKKELINANKRLSSLEEIISNIAHQWRQPLNIIAMHSSSLAIYNDLDTLKKDDLKKGLAQISKTTLELSGTLDNLNHIIQNSNDFVEENLLENINIIIENITLEHDLDKVSFEINIDENLSFASLWEDLKLVIRDILVNSLEQFIEKEINNPKILINAYFDNDYVLIKISDNANGIEDSIINHIFEPYTTTKFKSEGKGLGLYISNKIIKELLNGEIFAKNEEDGAVFTIKLKNN